MATVRYRFGDVPLPAKRGGAPGARGDGWYVAARGGATFPKDAEIKDNRANFDAFDVGYAASLAAGYRLGTRWRLELEAARRRNEAELIDFNPEFGEDRASGHVRADSLMLNAAYQPAWDLPFQPFAGIGVGMAWSDWDVRLDTTGETYVDDDDSAWAIQFELGAAAALTERLSGSVSYRYWQTGLFDMTQPDGRDLRTELTVHGVTLGLRVALP
jgi:opacity protein-like surface antigen